MPQFSVDQATVTTIIAFTKADIRWMLLSCPNNTAAQYVTTTVSLCNSCASTTHRSYSNSKIEPI